MKKCKAKIIFGDDQQDNTCTFHCGLKPGHPGPHQEAGVMWRTQPYTLTWTEIEAPDDPEDLEAEGKA